MSYVPITTSRTGLYGEFVVEVESECFEELVVFQSAQTQ